MAFTYDLSTDVGKVRLLITDTHEPDPIFQDDELTALLALEGGDVRLGSALALETIATNEVLILKTIKTLELETDGPAVARALYTRAKALRDQAEEDSGTSFEIAELVYNDPTARERLRNEALRDAT